MNFSHQETASSQTSFLSWYINALLRDPPQFQIKQGYEYAPNFVRDTMRWTFVCLAAMFLVQTVSKFAASQWYNSLDYRKKAQYPAYFVSIFHHCVVAPYGWYLMYQDMNIPTYGSDPANWADYSFLCQYLVPFLFGFKLADFFYYALPESINHNAHEMTIHHILAGLLFAPALYGPGALQRFYPHLMVCETTNILFNTAWLLRLVGHRDSLVVQILEIAFAVFFVIIRFINLTLFMGKLVLSDEGRQMGWSVYVLPLISALQWFWTYKILAILIRKYCFTGAKAKPTKKEN